MTLERFRHRLPFAVFVLFLLVAVIALGIACACATDHPGQTVDRGLGPIVVAPPVVELWTLAMLVLLGVAIAAGRVSANDRASPAVLQRFLF